MRAPWSRSVSTVRPICEACTIHSSRANWHGTSGNNWGFSYLLGAYLGVDSEVAWSSTSLNQRFALSYTGNSLNLTANVIWGTHFDHVTGSPQLSPCPTPFALNGCNPDFLNVDLTASRKFGDWEFGLVAFGSTDLNSPVDGYLKQSQVAVGGLIGKSFGPVILQAYLTTDVYEKNYGGHDTRLWGRFIIPGLAAAHADKHAVLQKGVKSHSFGSNLAAAWATKWGTASERANLLQPSGLTTTKAVRHRQSG